MGTRIVGRRMYTPYFFYYGSIFKGYSQFPKTLSGYPNFPVNETLDNDSYLLIRTLVSDLESFDLSGVVIRVEFQIIGRTGTGNYRITDIALDNLTHTTDFGKIWQIREKHLLRDVIPNFNPSDILYSYVHMKIVEQDLGSNIGNEWALSVLLNSPEP